MIGLLTAKSARFRQRTFESLEELIRLTLLPAAKARVRHHTTPHDTLSCLERFTPLTPTKDITLTLPFKMTSQLLGPEEVGEELKQKMLVQLTQWTQTHASSYAQVPCATPQWEGMYLL